MLSAGTSRAIASCEEQYPYLQAALDALRVVESPCGTAACSQHGVLYFDVLFISAITREQAGGLVAHEVWHWLSDHFRRRGSRDAGKWNVAADAEINDDLRVLPPNAVLPAAIGQPDGLPAERYYDAVQTVSVVGHIGGSASDGERREWETADDVTTAVDVDSVRDAVRDAILTAGAVPQAVRDWATSRVKVRLPSLSLQLRAAARRAGAVVTEDEPTFATPSRRQAAADCLLRPGYVRCEQRSVLVLLDTSGSMVAEMPVLLGVLAAFAARYGAVEWAMGDTAIRKRGRRPLLTELSGGGCTDVASMLRDVDAESHALIVAVTDGCTPGWPAPGDMGTPVVVVLTAGGQPPPMHIPYVLLDCYGEK